MDDPILRLVRAAVPPSVSADRRADVVRRASKIRRRRRRVLAGSALSAAIVGLLVPNLMRTEGGNIVQTTPLGPPLSGRDVGGEHLTISQLTQGVALMEWGSLRFLASLDELPLPPNRDMDVLGDRQLNVTGAVLTDLPGEVPRSGRDELQNTEAVVFIAVFTDESISELRVTDNDGNVEDELLTDGGLVGLVVRQIGFEGDQYLVRGIDAEGREVSAITIEPIPQRPLQCATAFGLETTTSTDNTESTRIDQPSLRSTLVPPPLFAPCP